MKKFLLSLPLLLALAVPATADAAPSAQVTRQVNTLLSAPEYIPTAADWTKLGDEAGEVLISVVSNDKATALKRARAASALVHFKGDAAKQALSQIVNDDKAYWLLRSKSALALAISYQGDALGAISPLLGHDNKRMREGAIKALGEVDTAASKQLLQSRRAAEKSSYLKDLIDTTLTRMNAKGGAK
jgi:hypothetical protein